MTPAPAAFPQPRAIAVGLSRAAEPFGLALRWATDGDRDALLAIYAGTRADELDAMPWPEAAKAQFVAQQFDLQHRHFVAHYPDADFLLLARGTAVVGRIYLDRSAGRERDLVVDIALLPAWRGGGIGGALLRAAQADATLRDRGIELHVLAWNAGARRLYERLGFRVIDAGSPHILMRWAPSGTVS